MISAARLTLHGDCRRFSAKLAQLKRAMSVEQQAALLSAMLKAVQAMPDLAKANQQRTRAHHTAGLADATNTVSQTLSSQSLPSLDVQQHCTCLVLSSGVIQHCLACDLYVDNSNAAHVFFV